ncbi:hypothetical protein BC833DRAFT_567618 [Globomyces pollinis-pini]|nr:hypothetical protein BC833DRAFT_567618 [Globomyces pollinis-pini]
MFIAPWIVSALSIQKHQDEAVIVNSEIVKLSSLLVDNNEQFIEQFDKKMKIQAEDFIKNVEANPWPDPRLLERARRYLNYLMIRPIQIPTRNGTDIMLQAACADSIALVQEPPNLLKKYVSYLPTNEIYCRQMLTRNYGDRELINFVTNNDTRVWTECEQYSNKVRETELQAYQDFIDTFIIAANNARIE